MQSLFMCGDVMAGRGIDQALPHPSQPFIPEDYIRDARDYIYLAEKANGPIQKPVGFDYIWGDAIAILEQINPDLRLINLETSVTQSDDYWPHKGVNYRMHPGNISSLTVAHIDCCSLANNHVLDWGYAGLLETLEILEKAHIKTAGAGRDRQAAEAPAVVSLPGKGRVIVYSLGSETSGIPSRWAASSDRPGVNLLPDLSKQTVKRIGARIRSIKQPQDIVVASIHWGSNWGYEISQTEREFAHNLIDQASVDLIHGHSSHHVKGLEVYNGKLILYGCGDLINDYEGIRGYEDFRDDLSLLYFATLDPLTGKLCALRMVPTQIKRFQLHRATMTNARWLAATLDRECQKFGAHVQLEESILVLR